MRIVIDIPEAFYEYCKAQEDAVEILLDIKNGTPLPKGHGRIVDIGQIDKDKIEKDNPIIRLTDENGVYLEVVSLDYLDRLHTIIEADKEEES